MSPESTPGGLSGPQHHVVACHHRGRCPRPRCRLASPLGREERGACHQLPPWPWMAAHRCVCRWLSPCGPHVSSSAPSSPVRTHRSYCIRAHPGHWAHLSGLFRVRHSPVGVGPGQHGVSSREDTAPLPACTVTAGQREACAHGAVCVRQAQAREDRSSRAPGMWAERQGFVTQDVVVTEAGPGRELHAHRARGRGPCGGARCLCRVACPQPARSAHTAPWLWQSCPRAGRRAGCSRLPCGLSGRGPTVAWG